MDSTTEELNKGGIEERTHWQEGGEGKGKGKRKGYGKGKVRDRRIKQR